ncbi:hypothetical protein HOF65_07875 [bacterium]|jgi:hypothetical protein|nr:hypothetical protein [bacterium]MBT3853809.1 hypothetical protein [bacterium]MBT4633635.1 hypothetical protein [bacterium]MBT6779377.1 hypothetical protein [bacterium]
MLSLKFNKSSLFLKNFDIVLAVFLPTPEIHNAVNNTEISTFLAFSTHITKLLTDFS